MSEQRATARRSDQAPARGRAADSLTIRRKRYGRGFGYVNGNGRKITAPEIVRRLNRLAVPPAYADVVFSANPRAPLQAMGRDAAGRWQYRYHPAWEQTRERRKAKRLARLVEALPRIRRRVTAVLSTRKPTREFAMAGAIALIDAAGLRSGTSRHARTSGARGAVSLLKSHVRLRGDAVTLSFPGKGGKRVRKTIRSTRLARTIMVLQRLPGRRLFVFQDGDQAKPIRVRDVNAYLCDIAACKLSLKDFRTLRASLHVLGALARTERASSEQGRKRQVRQAIIAAAEDLTNTPAVCRKSYVHEAVIEAFERDGLAATPPDSGQQAPARKILAEIVADHAAGKTTAAGA
jgi:DNA topoisomerase-1